MTRVDCMIGAREILREMGYTETGEDHIRFPDEVEDPHRAKLLVISAELLMAKLEVEDLLNIETLCVISDRIAQEIINRAMVSSSLKQRNVVGVITGLTGSGKTTLLHHLFGLPPPGLYTSTGVADESVRGLLHHTVHMSAGAWKRLSHRTSVLS